MKKAHFLKGNLVAILDDKEETVVKSGVNVTKTRISLVTPSDEEVVIDEETAKKIKKNPDKVKLDKGKLKFP